ncbi:MAG: hypothetical protein R3B93_13970 [Bacteroidia bacterium]
MGFLRDRINLDVTYYYIQSFDQILDAPLPASSGASQIEINTGKLENRGIEATIGATIFTRGNSYLRTSLNLARNRNFVVSLGDGAEILELANIWGI